MAVTQRAIITPELLDTLRGDPNLPDDVWYLVVATALCILNRPEEIQTIYTYVVAPTNQENEDEQLRIARRLREALLKTSAIGGMPKTINALQELKKVIPRQHSDEPHMDSSPTHRRQDVYESVPSKILARGQAFFDRCYGKVAERVMTSLDHSGTEDLGLAVRLTYGYVLSTTAILSEAETSFVMIAGLIPQDVNPQLKGHLKGALNGGASVSQVRAVRHLAIQVCECAGMKILTDEEDGPGGWGWRSEVQNL